MTEDHMTHSPTCDHPGVAEERGFTCLVRRCLSCGATTAERIVHQTPTPTNRKDIR